MNKKKSAKTDHSQRIAELEQMLKDQEAKAKEDAARERRENAERIAALEDQVRKNTTEWSDEQVAAFNAAEAEKMDKLVQKQDANRAKQKVFKTRDPNVIRALSGEDPIRCVSVRRVCLDDDEMSEVGEEIDLPREIAKNLQTNGAVRVSL